MRAKFLSYSAFFVLVFLMTPADLSAQTKRPRIKPITASVTVLASKQTPAQRRQDAFNTAWSTLNQSYFDKDFGGLDWNRIRAEYSTKVRVTRTDAEFHRLLAEMIKRLGKSHLSIIVPEYLERLKTARKTARVREKLLAQKGERSAPTEVEADDDDDTMFDEAGGTRYGIGIELRMLADKLVVSSVEKQSGAALAGIKPGYIVEEINGVSMAEMVAQSVLNGDSPADIRFLLPIEIVDSFLNGEPDSSVFVTCLDETDTAREFTVPRLALAGEAIMISKNLPEQFLKYESVSLSSDVGYVKFNAFAVPVIAKFCNTLTEFKGKKAIIVDLRGNLGGVLGSMIGLSGMLTDRQINLGTFISRTGREAFVVASKLKHFKGRVVLLVDGQSMSATELFTAGLQGNARAVVVGERTGGRSLPAVWIKLETGAVMLYPVADFMTPKGTSLEGVGLEPDHIVALERKALLQGVDTQLQRALAVANDETAFNKSLEPIAPPLGLSTSSILPPPPPPRAAPRAVAGTISQAVTPAVSDARSLKIVADFTATVGGAEAIKRIQTYEATGSMTAGKNGEGGGEIYAARQLPDKFVLVIKSPSVGEVREIYNGKTSIVQADFGLDRVLFPNTDTTNVHLFAPFFNALDLDYLRGLKYEGDYEVEGRMRQVLSATSPAGLPVGLSFDTRTKMLVTFSLPGLLYTLGDYRRTGDIMVPHQIDLDAILAIKLSSVTLNPKLDPGNFQKKEKCFDIPN